MILNPKAQPALIQSVRRPSLQISLPEYHNNNHKTAAFHDAQGVKIRAIFGGDRSGKSEAGGFELVRMAQTFPGQTF